MTAKINHAQFTERNQAKVKRRPTAQSVHHPDQKHAPVLELFQREDCVASHSVRMSLSRMGLDYMIHSVTTDHPLKHKMLVETGGKDQIPFLVDHTSGVKLYGASPIRAYLTNEYGSEPENLIEDFSRSLADRLETQIQKLEWTFRNARDGYETMLGAWKTIRSQIKKNVEKFRDAESNAHKDQASAST